MGDPSGFIVHDRINRESRPVAVRLRDWKEVYQPFDEEVLVEQASRCMDCGIPFCNHACPLGNIIPDWNDLVYRGRWEEASDRLHATNNFPEFTGRLCPAPCEGACVTAINDGAVTIKNVELAIAERAFDDGLVVPLVAKVRTGKRVAIVGSGPAGLACAQQLTRVGHAVTVYERDDQIGGLLRYGIPEFKIEKSVLDRRLDQLKAEGTQFRTNCNVGGPDDDPTSVSVKALRSESDVLILAGGATQWRDLNIPGRESVGVYQAMEYLPQATRALETSTPPDVDAKDRNVVIIGGGDTGADCLGTALRQGAASVVQFEIMDRPPPERADSTPWPTWPLMFRVSSAHQEGGQRRFSVSTTEFVARDGLLCGLKGHEVEVEMSNGRPDFTKVDGSEFELEVDLVFLALGFVGPETGSLLGQLAVDLDPRGNVARSADWSTSESGVFACGDIGRGQSLIVWAIAEGRACAAAVDEFLMGQTLLPSPVGPQDRPLH